MAKELINKIKNKMSMAGSQKSEDKSTKSSKTKKTKSKKTDSNKELDELMLQVVESKDKYLRLFAEFENFKKRNTKERLDLLKTAAQDTINSILPILDDFDRAKKSAEDDKNTESFSEGVTLVYTKLYSVLQSRGLNEMQSNGEVFDPELHEAITEIPAQSDEMKGKIIDTVEKGYYLNDKIIRFAKVVVGK